MRTLKSLLADLVNFKSVTPEDAGCQKYMINYLQELGFDCQCFDKGPVSNFFARYGTQKPLLVFAGHTDVVPIGEASQWTTPPFELTESNEFVYGRGVADMKGSLACMLKMATQFIQDHPTFPGSLGLLITSAEEGNHYPLGTPHLMAELTKKSIKIDYCIVGEPSSDKFTGDVIKIGRRGSLTGKLKLQGKQGHVAYPHLAENPIHTLSPALTELVSQEWDRGNESFPPTSLQLTYINAGGYANNIIPGEIELYFNFRFSTEQTADSLKEAVVRLFKRHRLSPTIEWQLSGEPFLTAKGTLLERCIHAIQTITGKSPQLSTSGGTSDGRFIAPYDVEVIELGPCNATIHQVNECLALADLEILTHIYYKICEQLLVKKEAPNSLPL